jgi:hypothetical protein
MEESNRSKDVIKRVNKEIKSDFSKNDIEILKKIHNSLLDKFNKW